MTRFEDELSPPFEIIEPPVWRAPIIFNSPHSGSVYPREFLAASRIDQAALRRSEDSFMDEIIADLTGRGFPIVRVNFPRSYVDVNREPYELDPRMFAGRLPSFANTRSMRVAGGLERSPASWRRPRNLFREARRRRRAQPDRSALQALSSRAAPSHQQDPSGVRRGDPRRLPLDAVGRRNAGRAQAPGCRDRRSLRHKLRRYPARCRGGNTHGTGILGGPEQTLRPAASSPNTTVIRRAGCIRFSSSSTARSTWMSGGASAVRNSAKWLTIYGAGRNAGRDPARQSRPVPGGCGIGRLRARLFFAHPCSQARASKDDPFFGSCSLKISAQEKRATRERQVAQV